MARWLVARFPGGEMTGYHTVLSYLLIFTNAIIKEHRNANTEVSWTAFLVSELLFLISFQVNQEDTDWLTRTEKARVSQLYSNFQKPLIIRKPMTESNDR